MIILCPTAAVMYGYALKSGSALAASIVFGSYAIATAIAVESAIFSKYRMTAMASLPQKEWVESLIMRVAGCIRRVFSLYGPYSALVTS